MKINYDKAASVGDLFHFKCEAYVAYLFGTFRTCGHVGYQVLSGHRRGWFDTRDLGAVLDHEEAPAPSGVRSSAIALQDHQRSVVRRRREGPETMRLQS